jgi:hypothetical protein
MTRHEPYLGLTFVQIMFPVSSYGTELELWFKEDLVLVVIHQRRARFFPARSPAFKPSIMKALAPHNYRRSHGVQISYVI